MPTNKNILVTGGAGFIGSNLIEALLQNNNTVTCLDNFSTGYRKNIDRFFDNPHFSLIEGDIRDLDTCRQAVEGKDLVYHEAALGSVPRSIENPVLSTHVNILGFVNMLTAAKDAKIPRFIYASSSSTYGDATYSPKVEDKKGFPLSPYAVTKHVNDMFARNFTALFGIETIGLCYFNVFGPYQDPNGAYAAVIPKFINLLLEHKQPTIYGDGKQSRDFTFVKNVVNANLLAGDAQLIKNKHEHINVACNESIDLTSLTNEIIQSLAKYDPAIASIQPAYADARKGDIRDSMASIEKAKRILGYSPKIFVKEGVEKTTEWFFQQFSEKAK
ncbi:MAG: SDR family oxidoreductase [Bacteroidales bacterium]|nr:SDR family oxidoreductase [Bacteroidales bacterium]MBR6266159.1 SDR family oxidoreductase [Bacteroidales bacterium]